MSKWKVIGRGKAGWHADAGTVVETYGKCKVSSSGGTLESYLAEAVDGAFVYDADEADDEAFRHHVIAGPMLDVDLPTGYYRSVFEWPKPRNGAKLAGVDCVALDIFEECLREIPHVKFGKVVNGNVVWELS
jgi:hypothetical protein